MCLPLFRNVMAAAAVPGVPRSLALLVGSLLAFAAVLGAPAAQAAPCDAPVVNKVACENTKPGNRDWKVDRPDDSIAGYTTDISATPGSTVTFKIKTNARRIGWTSSGSAITAVPARERSGTSTTPTPQTQPPCLTDAPTGLLDCGNWARP